MVLWSYPPTRKQLAITAGVFFTGVSFIAVGGYLSLANIAPQEARAQARREAIKNHLRELLGD